MTHMLKLVYSIQQGIRELPSNLGDLHLLKAFSIDENDVVEFPHSLARMTSLTSLSARHNQFVAINECVWLCERLKVTEASECRAVCNVSIEIFARRCGFVRYSRCSIYQATTSSILLSDSSTCRTSPSWLHLPTSSEISRRRLVCALRYGGWSSQTIDYIKFQIRSKSSQQSSSSTSRRIIFSK